MGEVVSIVIFAGKFSLGLRASYPITRKFSSNRFWNGTVSG